VFERNLESRIKIKGRKLVANLVGFPYDKFPNDANSKEIVHHKSRPKLNYNIKICLNHRIIAN